MTTFWAVYWTFGWATAVALLIHQSGNPSLEHDWPGPPSRGALNTFMVLSALTCGMVWPLIWVFVYDSDRWRG